MEQRLGEFRERKEREVVEQLERQMSKREEIMKNKALIEVRRREAEMRAEIEAALAVKRQEIKERLATLEARSDEFKQLAEDRLRKDIEKDLISDEDLEREALVAQFESKEEASEQDALLAKREAWMGALGTARSQTPSGVSLVEEDILPWEPVHLRDVDGRIAQQNVETSVQEHSLEHI